MDDTWKDDNVSLALSAQTYVKNVTEQFKHIFGTELHLQKAPMSNEYHPETDDTPLLDARGASIYHSLTGSANWAIMLGCFDVQYATQVLSQYCMAPREGHLSAMKQVFGYLMKFPKGKIVVDARYQDNLEFKINEFENWKEFYPDAEEELPNNIPTPFGKAT